MSAVHEKAAEWFARARSGAMSALERERLIEWKAADALHGTAYAEVEQAWTVAGKAAGHEAVRVMRAAALNSIEAEKSLRWRYGAVAAALLLALGLGYGWFGWHTPGGNDLYSTAVGERSTITLEDGSSVVLNTQTQMRVDFGPSSRQVTLLRGQALFDVAQDSGRPFVVNAADRRITALGTSFDVRVDAQDVRVTLLSGRVAVEEEQAPSHRAELAPGQQLIASVKGTAAVLPANVERATSWREGRLVFDNEPLAAVVEEMNRYSQRKVVLADAGLRELKISGTFRTGSPSTFIAALREYFPIEARDEKTGGEYALTWRADR